MADAEVEGLADRIQIVDLPTPPRHSRPPHHRRRRLVVVPVPLTVADLVKREIDRIRFERQRQESKGNKITIER